MKKTTVGLFERHAIAEDLARQFYAHLGYSATKDLPDRYMETSQHPQEMACYAMALTALDYFTK